MSRGTMSIERGKHSKAVIMIYGYKNANAVLPCCKIVLPSNVAKLLGD